MAKYNDPGYNQEQREADLLSNLYQASKNSGGAEKGNPDNNPYIPEEIDLRILRAAKSAVTPAPEKVSFLRRRWDIPVSVAATIMISTLLFINIRDEIPLPGESHLPGSTFDSRLFQEKQAEPFLSPAANEAAPSPASRLSERRTSSTESKNTLLREKDADMTKELSSFGNEKLPETEAAQSLTGMLADDQEGIKKQTGKTGQLNNEPVMDMDQKARLALPENNLQSQADAILPGSTPGISTKSKKEIQPITLKQEARGNQGKKDASAIPLTDSSDSPVTPGKFTGPEQWLKDIEQLLQANRIEAANQSLAAFRVTHTDYRLDTFCLKYKQLSCQ